MIIENDLNLIKFYDQLKIDRIFIDLERLGKKERQGHLDTVISNHLIEDIKVIKPILKNSELLVRLNPLNKNSKEEIEQSIKNGADILMLPMFYSSEEVEEFINIVNGRVKTCLLLETAQALVRIDDILSLEGIDEIHIGLNDLHLSLGLDFMFELLTCGIIDYLIDKIKLKNIPYGFGGVATLDGSLISGEMILKEHVRLGSSMVILSRAFKNQAHKNLNTFEKEFYKIKNKINDLQSSNIDFKSNQDNLKIAVKNIINLKELGV